jgi:hypothetical protein
MMLDAARTQLKALKAGPTNEEISIAKARIHQAEASLNALKVQKSSPSSSKKVIYMLWRLENILTHW